MRRFQAWVNEGVAAGTWRGLRLESLDSGRPEMRQTLDRAERFLNLVALLAALLSAVAVALAARGFAAGHLDNCALLRVLGLRQRQIARAYAVEFTLVGLAASVMGVAVGWCVHFAFVQLLSGLVESASLPLPGPWPAAFGLGMGLTLLVAFGLKILAIIGSAVRVPAAWIEERRTRVGTLDLFHPRLLKPGSLSWIAALDAAWRGSPSRVPPSPGIALVTITLRKPSVRWARCSVPASRRNCSIRLGSL